MALQNTNPTKYQSWNKLQSHFLEINTITMNEMFDEDKSRVEKFSIEWKDFFIDYSKNIINNDTIKLLLEVADECQLKTAISSYFNGECINETENRAVLHSALRTSKESVIEINGSNIVPDIIEVRQKIRTFTNEIINGVRKGYTDKNFTDVVNIGIGGSDLGPAMVVEGLQFYKNHLNLHFVSNIDGDHVNEILKKINPETTLFIVVSKTFTTQETLTNAETVRNWFLKSAEHSAIAKHFIAVSSNVEQTIKFGIIEDNIFPMWDWVGGRFSIWSAVGLSVSLAVGNSNFEELLKGANEMDEHFKTASFDKNIPVILALLSVWYNNFYGAETEAVIPYTQYLEKFVPYLQQGIMESNGKSTGRDGKTVNYQTGTIIWGQPGSNSQHAFFQLVHQGTKLIPTDFIGFIKPLHGNEDHHNKLMAGFFAQTEALLNGKSAKKAKKELLKKGITEENASILFPFKTFEGNKPTNSILIEKLTPASLGSLIALYEHKIFVQGIIWNIYSYDQWGVELGKELANSILKEIETNSIKKHDNSTITLLKHFLKNR